MTHSQWRGYAWAWVASAATYGSAHGTTEPTARNFDCVATPHCRASGSQAAIEYVATRSSAICELREIQLEQFALCFRYHDARDLGAGQCLLHAFRGFGADDDRPAPVVRFLQRSVVGNIVEHERVVELDLALDGDLRHPAAGGPKPALSQIAVVSPGSSVMTSMPGACCRSSSGVPASSGKVP